MKNDVNKVEKITFEMEINDIEYCLMQDEYDDLSDDIDYGDYDDFEEEMDRAYFYKRVLSLLANEDVPPRAAVGLYSREDIAINTIHNRIDENEKQLEKLELEEVQKKDASDSIIPAYKRFKTWADEFDEASFETKKMIANCLFERIEVSKGYKVRFVIDTTYQQFCEEWLDSTNINNL